MSLLRLILKAAAPLPDIEKNERFLFIGPHPDDIEIGAGATAAKLAAAGKSVCFLICLDGRYGSETIPPEELIEIRKTEAVSSAKMLGVSDVRFLNLSDGGFYDDAELIKGKRMLIVDDVISTGESLRAMEKLVTAAGGIIVGRMAVLAEGDAADRDDIITLAPLPVFNPDGTIKEK